MAPQLPFRLDLIKANRYSCIPNASHEWSQETYSMTLFASRPIMEGEEITIEYTKLTESRQTRRSRLFDMYHFHCDCECCNISPEEVVVSDAARMELAKWSQRAFRSPVEWCKNLALQDGYLVDGHKRCMALHEQERLIDKEYAMHAVELAIVYGMLADAKNFKLWGEKGLEALKTMRAPEAVALQQWLAGPQRNFKLWGMRNNLKEKARR